MILAGKNISADRMILSEFLDCNTVWAYTRNHLLLESVLPEIHSPDIIRAWHILVSQTFGTETDVSIFPVFADSLCYRSDCTISDSLIVWIGIEINIGHLEYLLVLMFAK
jgi:hypothetical protein